MKNTLEEEEYQCILKGRASKKVSSHGLGAKAMKGRCIRIKGGAIVGVKQGCTQPASQAPAGQSVSGIQWSGMVRNVLLYTRKKNMKSSQ